MLEQSETGEDRAVAIVSLKLALSQEVRASLAEVRMAQESAQRRARQQTMQARLWVVLLAGTVALGAAALGPRVAHWRQSRAQAAMSRRTAPLALAAAAPTPPAPIPQARATQPVITVESPIAKPAAPALREPEPLVAVAVAAPPVAAKASDTGVPAEGCDISSRRGLWRRSPEACAQAFAADPNNASLALAVAQAEHAHARYDEAAQWARRALALDPTAAEAYVIIARADSENGRADDARAAYQHYLELAPRGWHKAEARAALRRASSAR